MASHALTIKEFCTAHSVSRALLYTLLKDRKGPTIMKVGRRTLISTEAAEAWRRQMEESAARQQNDLPSIGLGKRSSAALRERLRPSRYTTEAFTMPDEVSLVTQIRAVRREIALREKLYPGFVAKGQLRSQEIADREIATMKAVHATLMQIAALAQVTVP